VHSRSAGSARELGTTPCRERGGRPWKGQRTSRQSGQQPGMPAAISTVAKALTMVGNPAAADRRPRCRAEEERAGLQHRSRASIRWGRLLGHEAGATVTLKIA
jgi:hypothetical protein